MLRREFMKMLAVAAGSGALQASSPRAEAAANMIYDPPRFGNLSLFHIGDTHAQLLPLYLRESACSIGVGSAANQAPFLVGENLLDHFRVFPHSRQAHALTYIRFPEVAKIYGKVGGFAQLATVIKGLRDGRPDSLLLDSGDTWYGSALSLRTGGLEMIQATRRLGVDVMTGDGEFVLGGERVRGIVATELKGRTAFLAQNVVDDASGESIFPAHSMHEVGGVRVAVIGEACPHIGRTSSRDFVPQWRFGIAEEHLQAEVNAVRAAGADVVVLLSHAGMAVDLKLARRVAGIDVIFGGHSHDAVPDPVVVSGSGGKTIVAHAGSGGKFIGVLDLDVRHRRLVEFRYRLLPVFANLIRPDPEMAEFIEGVRAPHRAEFERVVATTEGLLYRRGNFNGTFDQLILDAVRAGSGVDIAMSPGYRWGPTLLPGDEITVERIFEQTAVPKPEVRVETLTGLEIFEFLESGADRVFNPDPYLQTGEDMIRVVGLTYLCDPNAQHGRRIHELRFNGKPLAADRRYKVATWGFGREGAGRGPVWSMVERYLRERNRVAPIVPNVPGVYGVEKNLGFA